MKNLAEGQEFQMPFQDTKDEEGKPNDGMHSDSEVNFDDKD